MVVLVSEVSSECVLPYSHKRFAEILHSLNFQLAELAGTECDLVETHAGTSYRRNQFMYSSLLRILVRIVGCSLARLPTYLVFERFCFTFPFCRAKISEIIVLTLYVPSDSIRTTVLTSHTSAARLFLCFRHCACS